MAFSEQEKDEIAAAAWEAYRQNRLPNCGKGDYAELMTKWEELGKYTQEDWKAASQAAINQWAKIAHRS